MIRIQAIPHSSFGAEGGDTGTPKTKHIFTNMKLEIDDAHGIASGKTNYIVLQQTDELALQPIIAGHYEHRFEKRGRNWRITEKRFFVDQVGDLSHHLLIDLDATQTSSPGESTRAAVGLAPIHA